MHLSLFNLTNLNTGAITITMIYVQILATRDIYTLLSVHLCNTRFYNAIIIVHILDPKLLQVLYPITEHMYNV